MMNIFTDAGYKEHGHPLKCYFREPEEVTGNASVVFHHKSSKAINYDTCIIRVTGVEELHRYNAYILEAVGLYLGTTLRNAIRFQHPYGLQLIHTDCQSLHKQLQQADNVDIRYTGHYLLNKIKNVTQPAVVQWVRSHPEQRLPRKQWSMEDIGNDIANTWASPDPPEHENHFEITARQVMEHSMKSDEWVVTIEGLPYLGHVHKHIQYKMFDDYLQHRDDERVKWVNQGNGRI